jgi:uncharacterized membrane protein YdjX (TVP38/TMEM64 family)
MGLAWYYSIALNNWITHINMRASSIIPAALENFTAGAAFNKVKVRQYASLLICSCAKAQLLTKHYGGCSAIGVVLNYSQPKMKVDRR